jgi:predicted nucleic acid-binding protein
MTSIFLDTCILLDCLDKKHKHEDVKKKINHLKNKKYEPLVSYTVIGEMFSQCFTENKDFEIHAVADILREVNPTILFPTKELRLWCIKVDEANDEDINYGSSCTDRTHLAYAIVANSDYFVTHLAEVNNLKVPYDEGARTEVIDLDTLMRTISKR